jgi:hypothetical protein
VKMGNFPVAALDLPMCSNDEKELEYRQN